MVSWRLRGLTGRAPQPLGIYLRAPRCCPVPEDRCNCNGGFAALGDMTAQGPSATSMASSSLPQSRRSYRSNTRGVSPSVEGSFLSGSVRAIDLTDVLRPCRVHPAWPRVQATGRQPRRAPDGTPLRHPTLTRGQMGFAKAICTSCARAGRWRDQERGR
jgi:hypothetical protein